MSNSLFLALSVRLVPKVSKNFFFSCSVFYFSFFSTFTFLLPSFSSSDSSELLFEALFENMLEKIEPNGIAAPEKFLKVHHYLDFVLDFQM